MAVSEDFFCQFRGCSALYLSQCSNCCDLCFCTDHLKSHCPSNANSLVEYSQPLVVVPEDSVSRIKTQMLPDSTLGCWARSCFTKQVTIDKKTGKSMLMWKCSTCSQYFTINPKSTNNIREHVKSRHRELADIMLAKNNTTAYTAANSLTAQTHIDKRRKLVHFTQKGFLEWLVKYSVLTDQSFLQIENPAFRQMLDYCRPGIIVPSRKMIKEEMIETFQRKKLELKEQLVNVGSD